MPGAGSWVAQNMRRPGAYINFVSVPATVGTLGTRGVVAIAMPMSWGPENKLITLTGDDLVTGKSISIVGCDAFDTEASLKYRVACAGCYTALLFNTNRGGVKANATLGTTEKEGEDVPAITISAKYAGVIGNRLNIVVDQETGLTTYRVQVLYKDIVKETFKVTTAAELVDVSSEYVDFAVEEGVTAIELTAGLPLTGGTDGTVDRDTYSTFLSLLDFKQFQAVCIMDDDATVPPILKSRIQLWRENSGKKVQAVVYDYANADYEGVISVDQGFKTETETVGTDLFPLWVASMTAGAEVNESLTARVIEDAIEIINPVEDSEIGNELDKGRFMLSYRQDSKVVVEQDINTLQTFTVDKQYAFSKNRVIRTLDEIGNTAALIFNRNYCGRVNNDDTGRNQYKTEIISLIDQLVAIGAVNDFGGASDIQVYKGSTVDSVRLDVTVKPTDALEKLYMTVNVQA